MDTNIQTDSSVTTPDAQGNVQEQSPVNPGAIRKSTTQSILKAVSNAAGMDFQSIEDLTAALARLSVQQTTVAPTQQTQSEPQVKRNTMNDLQEQFQQLRQDLSKKEQMLKEKELDSDIRLAMGDKFDTDLSDYALNKVRANIQWNDDGSYSIINSKGQVRYGEDGNPMSIQGLVNEVAKTNPKLLKSSQNLQAGSGLRPNQAMFGGDMEAIPDYTTDPAGFNAWASRNGLGRGQGLKQVRASVSVGPMSKRVL